MVLLLLNRFISAFMMPSRPLSWSPNWYQHHSNWYLIQPFLLQTTQLIIWFIAKEISVYLVLNFVWEKQSCPGKRLQIANKPEYVVVLYQCTKRSVIKGLDLWHKREVDPHPPYEVVQIFSLLRGKFHYNCSQNKDQRDEVEQHIFWEFYCCFHLPSKDFFHIQTSIYLLQIIPLQGKENFPLVGPTSGCYWWAVP